MPKLKTILLNTLPKHFPVNKFFLPSTFFLALLLAAFTFQKSATKKPDGYRIAFYNCENFFDTINDLDVQDEEFTPAGKDQWTSVRYQTKVEHLAKVISSIAPDFIGLSEVENKNVLKDLVKNVQLLPFNFEIVHINSPDPRGIDVAFLYRKDKFNLIGYHAIHVSLDDDTAFRTRDILQVEGTVANHDTVCFFINHWPSRRGGAEQSEPKRIAAAAALRSAVNQFAMAHPSAEIIVMGDLNDNPDNKSVHMILQADSNVVSEKNSSLFNPSFLIHTRTKTGSLYYNGSQDLFDQIIISDNLVKKNGGKEPVYSDAKIFRPDWLFKTNDKGASEPWRTYEGVKYSGGYSDHLPAYVQLKL